MADDLILKKIGDMQCLNSLCQPLFRIAHFLLYFPRVKYGSSVFVVVAAVIK